MRIVFSSTLIAVCLFSAVAAAQSVGAVKVDCEGNCDNVRLGDICDTLRPGSEPVALSCDDTADPGRTFGTVPCGNPNARRQPTCSPYGRLERFDLLGDYCTNGEYNDAVVTCSLPERRAARSEDGEASEPEKEEQPYSE